MLKKNILFLFLPILIAAALNTAAQNPGTAGKAAGTGVHPVIAASNAFAFDLYKRLSAEDGNMFFSPYSLTAALAMTYEGARGKTAAEIKKVLRLPGNAALRRNFFANDLEAFNTGADARIVNAFWSQKDYAFLPAYTDILRKSYRAESFSADFKQSADEARLKINEWTAGQTAGRIMDLFPQNSLNALTRLVLVDSVYFKGKWEKQFDKDLTDEADFFTAPGNKVKVNMMKRTGEGAKFNYCQAGDLQLLELPYKSGGLSMLIILPAEGGLKELEREISPARLDSWKKDLYSRRVDVFLPRFSMTARYALPGILSEMGMPRAFTDKADFSGMDGTKNLYIQQVVHQGFVEVNEEGTEAAAASGVAMGLKSMPMPAPQFRANRPFIFLIQERGTGKIIFMGRVEKP